ncbi:Cyclin, C-terminal domain [Dillenia turbinata]|uniref:Cyclin, C-terminal domain n=1 Tax=Dillenia turbinata TaxID=194707 RepID=A0AAN8YY00_9MAGN
MEGCSPFLIAVNLMLMKASRSQVKVEACYLMTKSVMPILKAEVKISNRPDNSSSISIVAMSKNEEANTSSLSLTTACKHSEKGFPYEKCNLDTRPPHDSLRRTSNRRRSYTSLLMASSMTLEEQGELMKLERLPNIDDKCNHLEVAEYVDEIYHYYRVTEAQNPSLENYMVIQTDITTQLRGILINWLIGVILLDRYLSMVAVKKNELQLVGLTTLLPASRYEDCWPPTENVILKRLKFRLDTPTSHVFMLRFLKAAQLDTKFKPSLLSACTIYAAHCTLQLAPAWTSLLSRHTRYEEPKLREGAEMIIGFQTVIGTGLLNVTYEKYLSADLSCVANILPLDRLPL